MLKLTAEKRDIFGKELKKARIAGKMPVVIYGAKDKATSLFVMTKEFKKLLSQAGESTMITVDAGDLKRDVLIHDVDFHPVNGEPVHADLYVVDKTKTVEVKVPLKYEGVSAAVKDLGGTLVKVLHELEIEVLPTHIPHEIMVDISLLATLESQVLVSDLKVPKEVKVLVEPETVVAAISVAKEEPIEEAPVDLSAIEVEKKGKKEEEGAAEGEAIPKTPEKKEK
jgi:large subunit ribosomal protein L25